MSKVTSVTVDEAERLASELVRDHGAPAGLDTDILLVQLSLEKISGVAEIALMLLNQRAGDRYVLSGRYGRPQKRERARSRA